LESTDWGEGDGCARNRAFSRCIALSLAARGAAGKNWAKLAPGGRVIARRGDVYLSHRPPTVIFRVGKCRKHHACVPTKLVCAVVAESRAHRIAHATGFGELSPIRAGPGENDLRAARRGGAVEVDLDASKRVGLRIVSI